MNHDHMILHMSDDTALLDLSWFNARDCLRAYFQIKQWNYAVMNISINSEFFQVMIM